jgi:hypothetical protein
VTPGAPIYCVSHVSSTGVAMLVNCSGAFVCFSHVTLLASFPANEVSSVQERAQ